MGESAAGGEHGAYRAALARDFPDLAGRSFVYLGEGEDNVAFEVGGETVIRFAKGDDGSSVACEARILRHVAAISPLPVPIPIMARTEGGYLGYRKLPGTPLLGAVVGFDLAGWPDFAATIGAFLSAIHAAPLAPLGDALPADDDDLDDWREEARATFARVRRHLPRPYAGRVADFLAATPPDAPFAPVLAHNDLGIEHILVDAPARRIMGIIDWSDAALTDPARDLGLLCRDLGPTTLEAVLDHYTAGGDRAALRARAIFYARCGMLEDLEYGQTTGRAAYTDKGLAALPWLFP